ncbi:MAG: hypothetical protein Ct9H90mP2_00360 [Dehalococcoidia bacterium]|nr:MAG: hypothetical protein Ct9H90mP2_00360 [Dehalococcoidia bacterium]
MHFRLLALIPLIFGAEAIGSNKAISFVPGAPPLTSIDATRGDQILLLYNQFYYLNLSNAPFLFLVYLNSFKLNLVNYKKSCFHFINKYYI